MLKPYSTKRWKPVPADFERFFIERGWTPCNISFGKRETDRYVTALGRTRMEQARREYRKQRLAAAQKLPAGR